MQFWIMKSGLEIFDVARVYGLAALLSYADEMQSDSPIIQDAGAAYLVELRRGRLTLNRLKSDPGWASAFQVGPSGDMAPQWNKVFLTTHGQQQNKKTDKVSHPREGKIDKVKDILEGKLTEFSDNNTPQILATEIGKGELLPGPLDPSAFKGLKHATRGEYKERGTLVDNVSWAMACLGAALAGRFLYQQSAGYFVIYPVPESITWADFREVRGETYGKPLRNYLSVQNAAAHYSVVLAEHLRKRAASGLAFAPRYSNLLYFSMFKTGGQPKPGGGGRLNLHPLLDLALGRPHEAEKVFKVWIYLFKRGSARGNEDLALAITELVMHPSLESYERHVRVLKRYIAKGTNKEFQYTDQSLKEVMTLVSS